MTHTQSAAPMVQFLPESADKKLLITKHPVTKCYNLWPGTTSTLRTGTIPIGAIIALGLRSPRGSPLGTTRNVLPGGTEPAPRAG